MRMGSRLRTQGLVNLLFATSLSAATVDGIPLHSSAYGKGPRTLILVHGWTCDDRTWALQVPELSKSYRVITLDLPGHGQSGSPKDGKLSMDLFARAIEAVREEQRAERVVLAGHSMGTAAIMQYARLYPEHTVALVLVDGSVSMPASVPRDPMLSFAKQYGESLKAREAAVQAMFTANTTQEVRKQVLSMILAVPSATPLAAMEAFVDSAIWKEDVFPQPVLAVSSDMLDAKDRESDLDYMKTRFPNLEYVKMAGTGHFLMLEKPAQFNALLKSFVDRLKY
jgi:pimeloyl-ACP methyl ester carboxylesterase